MNIKGLILYYLVSNAFALFNLIHFNDSYELRNSIFFLARVEKEKKVSLKNLEITFSGDLISPSKESTLEKGLQYKMFMEKIGPTTAVVGNHEFDFGSKHFHEEIYQLKNEFKWLASNLYENKNPNKLIENLDENLIRKLVEDPGNTSVKLIGKLESTRIVDLGGVKICYLSLVDQDFFKGMNKPEEYGIADFKITARFLGKKLRRQGCEVIIALTHMDNHSDMELINDPENHINFVLGGHIHEYSFNFNKGHSRFVLKSGVDFKNFSVLNCEVNTCTTIDKEKHFDDQFESTTQNIPSDFCIPFINRYQ